MRRLRHAARALGFSALLSATALAAPKSPRQTAQDVLKGLEEQGAKAAISAEPVARTKDALDRARSLREAGDAERGTLVERLARQWALVARDLLRTARAERAADEAERELADAETRAVRARALLEETVARRGRAEAALKEAEGGDTPAEAPKDSKEAPGANVDQKEGQP